MRNGGGGGVSENGGQTNEFRFKNGGGGNTTNNKDGGGSYLSRYTAVQQQQQHQSSPRQPAPPPPHPQPSQRQQTDRTAPSNPSQGIIKKKRAHFKDDTQRRGPDSDSPDQQQLLAEQNMILNSSFYNSYSPLSTPANYRNNNTSARMIDPYGINPLPNIRSPYYSSRDAYVPNLESWGVNSNNSSTLFDPFYFTRNSPFLPYYSSLAKQRKVKHIFILA